jgi:hypothetical protein
MATFEYLEAYQHGLTNKMYYPLMSFEIPLNDGVMTYMTAVFRYTQHDTIRRTYYIDLTATDIVSKMGIKVKSIFTPLELLGRLITFGEECLKRPEYVSSNTLSYKRQALNMGIDKMLIKVVEDTDGHTRVEKIQTLKSLIHSYRAYYPILLAYEHLEKLMAEEADFRYYSKHAKCIQQNFKQAIAHPDFLMCQQRLLKEYEEMDQEIYIG